MKLYQIFIFVGVFIFTSAMLTSCSASKTEETTSEYILPDGLKDCKVYHVAKANGGSRMKVIRCPNSQTTTQHRSGKTNQEVTLITEGL